MGEDEISKTPFQISVESTKSHEGTDFYDGSGPWDPNPTLYGVTQRTYDAYRDGQGMDRRSVELIAPHELEGIYMDFWRSVHTTINHMGPLSAPLYFDHVFNAGPGAAIRVLQRAIDVEDDGIPGRETLGTLRRVVREDFRLAMNILAERLVAYDDITDRAKMRTNLKAWVGRLTDYYRKYLRPL